VSGKSLFGPNSGTVKFNTIVISVGVGKVVGFVGEAVGFAGEVVDEVVDESEKKWQEGASVLGFFHTSCNLFSTCFPSENPKKKILLGEERISVDAKVIVGNGVCVGNDTDAIQEDVLKTVGEVKRLHV